MLSISAEILMTTAKKMISAQHASTGTHVYIQHVIAVILSLGMCNRFGQTRVLTIILPRLANCCC